MLRTPLHTLAAALLCAAAPAWALAQHAAAGFPQAVELFRAGKVAEAETELRQLLKVAPGDAAAWNLLGAVLDSRKKLDEAETCFKKALQLAPGSAAVLNNLGNHYLDSGKPDEALAAFEKVLALVPGHQNANLQLARLLTDRRQGKRALDHLARLKAPDAEAPSVQLTRARALHQSGRAKEAEALFSALEKNAAGPAAWHSLGMALGEIGEYGRAETAFSRALETAPGNLDVLHNLGLAALRAGHAERAQQVYEAVLRAQPDDAEALFQLGRAVAQQGRYDEAILVLVRARRLAPQRADIIRTLATTAAQAGFFGDAALAFDDYLKLRPDDEVARRERGFAYSCAGNKAEALPDLEWYVKRHPNDPVGRFQFGFGLTVSDRDKAFVQLNEAIRLRPDYPEARLVRGALYQAIGKPGDALPDLEYAVSCRPDHIRAIALLGRAYLELDRPKDAVRVLRSGYEKAPGDSQILMTFGRALLDAGQEEEGARVLQEFAKVGPDRALERSIPGTLALLSLPPEQFGARYEANLRGSLKTRPSDWNVRGKLARFLLNNNRREEAVALYREILAGQAEPNVLVECGRALIEAGDFTLARDFLSRALAAGPDTGVQLDFVVALLGAGEAEAALRELDKVAEKDRLGDYYLLRAQVCDVLGRVPEAAENLNLGFRKAPTRGDLYEKAAQFLLKHSLDAQALNLLEQATALLPDDANLLLLKATLLGIQNRADDALSLLRGISARWPEWSRPYLVRGIIEENHARSQEALKNIRTAMAMGENSPEAYYYLAQSLSHVDPDHPKPALDAIQKALELDPADPWAQALAGRLSWEAGDNESSVRYLKEAIRLKKDFVRAHFWLGATYRSLGKEEEAAAEMAEVENIHKRNPQAEAEEGPGVRARLFPAAR